MTWTKQFTIPRKSIRTAASNQLVAETGDAAMIPGTPGLSAGFVYFARVYVDQSLAANTAHMAVVNAGVGCANSFIGVYDPSTGLLLAETADVSTEMNTAAILSQPLTSTVPAQSINRKLWLAVLIGSHTTSPGFVGRNSTGTNLGLTSDYRLWLSHSGGFSALPSSVPAMDAASSSQSIPYISIGP